MKILILLIFVAAVRHLAVLDSVTFMRMYLCVSLSSSSLYG